NQDVNRTLGAIARDDAVLADFGNSFGDEFDVRAIEGGIVIVGNENALAAELITWRERGAHLGVFDVPREVAKSNGLDHLAESLIAKKAEDAEFLAPEKELAQGPAGDGDGTEAPPPFFADGKIEARDDPRRRALKKRKLADAGRDLRDELDGAGAGADNGDVFAVQVHFVIPGGGMKRRALETVEALEIRITRDVQGAHAGNQHARTEAQSVSESDVPGTFGFIPSRFAKACVQADM